MMPSATGNLKAPAIRWSKGHVETPSHGRGTYPLLKICGIILFAISTGTANPMPIDPPPAFPRIAVLMPIISPFAFSSGPPELPGLIAKRPFKPADDTSSQGPLKSERISDRQHLLANVKAL